VQAQFETLGAGAPEVFVAGYCEMAAFATGESPVASGCHRPKLIARDAVRASNRDQGHGYIHPHIFFALSLAAAKILSVADYRNVKNSAGSGSPFVLQLNTPEPPAETPNAVIFLRADADMVRRFTCRITEYRRVQAAMLHRSATPSGSRLRLPQDLLRVEPIRFSGW
jgi:hypothetical protein